jgi:hypothetical protein
MLVRLLFGVAFNAKAIVSVSDGRVTRYDDIVSRNAFGLRPPEKSHTEPSAPVVARPKIRLVGITTLLGRRTAFLMVPAVRPGGVSECLLLREGETQEEIQLKEIDEKGGVVNVINHGKDETLDFDGNVPESVSVPDDVIIHVDRKNPNPLPAPEKPSLTPEQQTLMIEAQRLKVGDPLAKILPQTEFTAEVTGETP